MTAARAGGLPGQDPVRDAEKAREQAMAIHYKLAALPPACTVGTGHARQGKWLTAFNSAAEPGNSSSFIYLFETAPVTGALRAGLNRAALRELEKVEFRDAAGKWVDAGPVAVHEAPDGCDYVWLQQDLGGTRKLDALRYTFRRSMDTLTLSEVAVLR
jgi:hypothetical protein